MKFMKIGTKPDTFYTEHATRTVICDISSDLIIRINNISYLLHRFALLPKCRLLQRLCSDSDEPESVAIELHDIPGGSDAFELCAKFCYGITINLSAHNFVDAFCAAMFLRMSDSFNKGNFVEKLEAFFHSCILEGWKDSIVTLQTTVKLPEWSENLGVIRKCIDSILEKILTPTEKVSWSYTYTRPGYNKKQHQPVPRDWWTEDISDLDLDMFRCIIIAVRSTFKLPPQLIGESLHVYACRWIPEITATRFPSESSTTENEETLEKSRRVAETIVNMIPLDKGSVSVGFLLRLLSIANYAGASLMTKTELVQKASVQFEEATLAELLLPSRSLSHQQFYDTDLVTAVAESYFLVWRRQSPGPTDNNQLLRSIRKVGKLIDSYLQVIAQDAHMEVSKLVSLAEAVPDIARENHDSLYKAINIYLKAHPDKSKEEKKRLCRSLDCQKLSKEVRAHAVKNERLPLRTVVQVLFFDQESGSKGTAREPRHQDLISRGKQTSVSEHSMMRRLHLGPDNKTSTTPVTRKTPAAATSTIHHRKTLKAEKDLERKETNEEETSGSKLEPKNILQRRTGSDHGHDKGRDR